MAKGEDSAGKTASQARSFADLIKQRDRNPFIAFIRFFRPELRKDEALYALMAAAVAVDGRRVEPETLELYALKRRSKELKSLPLKRLNAIRKRIDERTTGDKIFGLIHHACESLPKKWRLSAFAHAADIIMADLRIVESERDYLTYLIEKLKLKMEDASLILVQLKYKNEHVAEGDAAATTPVTEQQPQAVEDRTSQLIRDATKEWHDLSPPQAMFAIIATASMADGQEQLEEHIEIDALMRRSPTLAKLDANARQQLREDFMPRARPPGQKDLLDLACRALPQHLRLSAFGHAADIVFADGRVLDVENQYLADLARRLGLSTDEVKDMMKVLRIKNEH